MASKELEKLMTQLKMNDSVRPKSAPVRAETNKKIKAMVPGPDGLLYDDTKGYYDKSNLYHATSKPNKRRLPKPSDQRQIPENSRWTKMEDKKYDVEKEYVPKNDDQKLLDYKGDPIPKIGDLPRRSDGGVDWTRIPREQLLIMFAREHAMRIYSTRQLKNKLYYKNIHIHLLKEYMKVAQNSPAHPNVLHK